MKLDLPILQLFSELSTNNLVLADCDLKKVHFASPKLLEELEATEKSFYGFQNTFLNTIIHPTESSTYQEILDFCAQEEIRKAEFECRMICSGDSQKWFRINLTLIDEVEHLFGRQVLMIFTEITKEKLREIELNATIEKARQMEALKLNLLANLNHEIRTPLNGILGFAELLKDPQITTEERQSFREIIIVNGRKLLDLVSDIIDASLLQSNQFKLNPTSVQPKDFLDQLYTKTSREMALVKECTQELIVNLPKDQSSQEIYTDPEKLQKVMQHLINNAITHSNSSEIEIGYENIGSQVLFYVQDNGIGINEKEREEIFQLFHTVEKKPSYSKRGIGLGLYLCKGIVQSMQGNISLKTDEENRTRFEVVLPSSYSYNASEKNSELQLNFLKGRSILIADDDWFMRKYYAAILKPQGADLFFVDNGKAAINQYKLNQSFDFVLMNLSMPVMGGMDAMKGILDFDPSAKVIAQTGHVSSGERGQCLSMGFTDYISKPIKKKELLQILRYHLEQKSRNIGSA